MGLGKRGLLAGMWDGEEEAISGLVGLGRRRLLVGMWDGEEEAISGMCY